MSEIMTKHSLLKVSGLSAFALLLISTSAQAKDPVLQITIHPGSYESEATPLDRLPIYEDRPGSLTVPGIKDSMREMSRIPGAVDLVPAQQYANSYAQNLEDALGSTPGVTASKRFGAEVRLAIRGSGLSRGFHMRGLELLQDGIPYNIADGSADFQEIDPLIAQQIEVYKGGNGLRYGASTLGGAINFVTPSGYTAPARNLLRVEGGSFGTLRSHAEMARVIDNVDLYGALTAVSVDGYRAQEAEKTIRFSGNLGYRFNGAAETRTYLSYNSINQELPGSLTRNAALATPQQAATASLTGHQARNVRSLRVANKSVIEIDTGEKVEFGVFFNEKRLFHPIFQVIDQEGFTTGGFARYELDHQIGSYRNEITLGSRLSYGENRAKQYVNVSGSRGGLTSDGWQTSSTTALYAEDKFHVTPDISLIAGLQGLVATRDFRNILVPSKSDGKTYHTLSPRGGMLWDVTPAAQVWANVTRSYEPPTFSELIQSTVFQFVPLAAQKAVTYEVGTRGATSSLSWNIALYRADLSDELVAYSVGGSIPASTFNADRTIHQGLEAGLTIDLARLAGVTFAEGEKLLLEEAYTYSDFRFDGDAIYGDNKLAGQAPHILVSALRYRHGKGFDIAPKLEWVPDGGYVDYSNTTKSPGYALIGLEAGYDIAPGLHLFVDARNLADRRYISTYSTEIVTTGASAVYYPGEGRSVFAGLSFSF